MSDQTDKKATFRWGDWLSVILLVIILQVAAARLVATLWTKDLRLVQMVTLLGTILGLALGKSIFKGILVGFFAFAYGLAIVPWQLGLTMEPEIIWHDRLVNLWGRLGAVISDVFTREPVTDNLLFLLLMALLFWVISVYSAYTLLREGNPWKVIIPGGIAAFAIHSFDPLLVSRSWYLAFYLFFGLVLVARLVFLKNSARWRESRTHTPPDMGFDFSRVTLLLSMLLVFFAWNVPVLAESFRPAAQVWQTASRPWLSTKDRLGFMFASLRASVGLVQNFYGETLALGLGNPLSDQVVLEVEGPTDLPNGYRFYWQARTYSKYESNFWRTDQKPVHNLTSESLYLNQPGADVRPVVITTFFPHAAISNLYAAPDPLWVNLPTKAYMEIAPDGSVNFEALMGKDFIRPGEQYTVRSAIDAVDLNQLRTSGTTYPEWVLEEYLQLPDSITPRTRELAEEIAAGLSNPYDIANAVTLYLRENIVYNQSVIPPPANQERIDWFLFDYKEGFCNYYASAEVVLLRSLGIPARMSVGFAQGERQVPPIPEELPSELGPEFRQGPISETSTYVVRQKDAHAWPEVYFPGIGWVIFEPTVSQPELFRPAGETFANQNQLDPAQPNPDDPSALEEADRPGPGERDQSAGAGAGSGFWSFGNVIKLIVLLFALVLLGIVVWQVRKGFKLKPFIERMSIELPENLEKSMRRMGIRPPEFLINWVYYQRLPVLHRSYLEINRALKRVGKKPSLQDTPSERTALLVSTIPSTSVPAERLLAEYHTSVYSPRQANVEAARKAGSDIRYLSWMAWLNRILKRFQEPDRDRSG